MENILLSYPRSGNHLVRFFIELLSEIPTYGCKGNKLDIEIYKNEFPEEIPFNIHEQDRAIIRNSIVEALVHAPANLKLVEND